MSHELVTFIPNSYTMKAAKDAIDCQDTCNALGVLNSFTQHMKSMNETAGVRYADGGVNSMGTAERNQHPVAVLFIDKLASLAGTNIESVELYSKAYDACKLLADGKEAIFSITRH